MAERSDEDTARIVAVKLLLAKPEDREEVLRTEIPLMRLGMVLPLVTIEMAGLVDRITARSGKHRLQLEGVLRTYLRAVQ